MKLILRLVVVSVLLGLTGCNILPAPQADSVRYFTLNPGAATPFSVDGTTVRPVKVAGHLRNREMAVRVAENEVIYLEGVHWAESLGDSITQLLRVRLGAVGGNSVVTVQVQRCELVRYQGNAVHLVALYSILTPGEGAVAKRGVFAASPRTWDGKDYGALVGLLRDGVSELGDVIAAALPDKK